MENSINKFVLDVGNKNIKLLAGELDENGEKLKVLSYVEVETQGMRKNIIENPIALSECIKKAIKLVQDETHLTVDKVSLGYGGTNIFSRTKNIKIDFGGEKIITKEEIEKLFEIGKQELINSDEELLESEFYNAKVNNGNPTKNPIGMVGRFFQADVHLIFIKKEDLNGLIEVVHRAGLEIECITLNAYAAARATLKEEDKKSGVALIDIGGGTTDIIIYKNNKLIYTKSLPLGGNHYISDLGYIYNLTPEEAQSIIDGTATMENDKYILPNKNLDVKAVCDAINARSGDFINFIRSTIDESGFQGYLEKGIFLTGGVAQMDSMYEWINIKIGYPVTRVSPLRLMGNIEPKPEMAVCIGILLEVMEKEYLEIKKQQKAQAEIALAQARISAETQEEKTQVTNKEENTEEKKDEKKESFWKKWFSNFI